MTVLYTTIEPHPVIGKMLIEVVNQHCTILRLEVATIVCDDVPVFQRDDVAANSHVVRCQFHTDAGGLQWATALIHLILVITENAAVRHLAARMKTILHRLQHAATSHFCQLIHIGNVGILQQRLISQRLHRPVSHSVAQYDDMLHIHFFQGCKGTTKSSKRSTKQRKIGATCALKQQVTPIFLFLYCNFCSHQFLRNPRHGTMLCADKGTHLHSTLMGFFHRFT